MGRTVIFMDGKFVLAEDARRSTVLMSLFILKPLNQLNQCRDLAGIVLSLQQTAFDS